jgi:hypothetical protein
MCLPWYGGDTYSLGLQEPAVAVASLEDQMEVATSLANLAEVHYNKKVQQ